MDLNMICACNNFQFQLFISFNLLIGQVSHIICGAILFTFRFQIIQVIIIVSQAVQTSMITHHKTESLMLDFMEDYTNFNPYTLDHSINSESARKFNASKLPPILNTEASAHPNLPTLKHLELSMIENTDQSPIQLGITSKADQSIKLPQTDGAPFVDQSRKLWIPNFDSQVSASNLEDKANKKSNQEIKKPRKTQQIMILYKIKSFLTKISAKRRQKLFFKEKHFILVGDKASERNQSLSDLQAYSGIRIKSLKILMRSYRQMINRLQNMILKLLKPIPLIYPQSLSKMIWDFVLGFILIYFFVMIPLEVAFNNGLLFKSNGTCTLFFTIFLILDFLSKMNTIYYEFGQPVIDRSLILDKTLNNGFWIDLLSISSLLLALTNRYTLQIDEVNLVLFVFFSQGHYFRKIINNFEESLNLSKEIYCVLQLLKLILTLVYVEHIFSCLWYFVANYEQSQNMNNWMSVNGLQHESWDIKYLNSFYFSTVTMLSVGYGDIVPSSPVEKILSIMFMMFACVQLSYSVNTVGDLLNQLTSQSDESRRRLRVINNFMNNKRISFGLQYQIREYLKIYWAQEFSEISGDEEQIIGTLSENLKNKLIKEANENILLQCPLFRNHFSANSKSKILKVMKTIVVNPEHIINSNLPQFDEPCLCFIEHGELNVFISQGKDQELMTYYKGQYFGLEELVKGTSNEIKMSSYQFVKLIVLQRSDFLRIISESHEDYEEFCMIRDKFLHNSQPDYIKCDSCLLVGHSLQYCPLIHFQPDKEKLIKQQQWDVIQERDIYQRSFSREKNTFRTRLDLWVFQEVASVIQQQEFDLQKFYSYHSKRVQKEEAIKNTISTMAGYVSQKNNESLPQRTTTQLLRRRGTLIIPTESLQQFDQKLAKQVPQRERLRIRKKFQDSVHKVIILLRMNPVKKILSLRQSKILKNYSKFKSNFEEQVVFVYAENHDYYRNMLSEKDYENCLLMVNMYGGYKADIFQDFDQSKNFDIYFPHNNFQKMLDDDELYERYPEYPEQWKYASPHLKFSSIRKRILRKTLIRYLFYPFSYFNQFLSNDDEVSVKKQSTTERRETKRFQWSRKSIAVKSQMRVKKLKSRFRGAVRRIQHHDDSPENILSSQNY